MMLKMRKRPIAHWDPAMYAVHVMMYNRAPLHTGETQTSIVLRDIMDNVRLQGLGSWVHQGLESMRSRFRASAHHYGQCEQRQVLRLTEFERLGTSELKIGAHRV